MISIVVPCYNSESTLERCCDSILRQTGSNYEVILVDDGSTDGTGKLCDLYASKYSNVSVIHQENKGLMNAWKTGVTLSKGEYIIFSDSDDWIEDSLIENLEKVLKKYNPDIITYGITTDYDDGRIVKLNHLIKPGYYARDRIEKEILPCYFASGSMETQAIIASRCSKAFKRYILIDNFELYDESISVGEDDLASFAAILDAESIYHIGNDYAPYHYCRHADSMMGSYGIKTVNKLADAYDSLNVIALRKKYNYQKQIDLYFLDNILVVIKKELCSGKKYKDISQEIYGILNIPKVNELFAKEASLVKGYRIKEKIFYYLTRNRKLHTLYLITKMVTYGGKT